HISTSLYSDSEIGHDLLIFALQDISLLKKMEKECQSPERIAGLEIITDQISHQIRNPIASIGGFALRLAKTQVSSDEYVRYIEIIHNEAKRLEYLIDRLVELSKVHHARFSIATLDNVFEQLKNLLEVKDKDGLYKVIFQEIKNLSEETFYCDPGLIAHALYCIVKNSLEAIKEDGEVIISGSTEDDRVIIKIKDNGCGIGPEALPFIFDPFFTTKFNNLGLGLTMARRIVSEHKGTIEAHSVPDQGTEIIIVLPRERRREVRRRLMEDNKDIK
ncbi:MAG: ATP-binding protein, partial [Syntrophorhabdaceae bacterium]|nr:ATP-binding protein [Syntrophorhabdaceae bacterium]